MTENTANLYSFRKLLILAWNRYWQYFGSLVSVFSIVFLLSLGLYFSIYGADGFRALLNLPVTNEFPILNQSNFLNILPVTLVDALFTSLGTGLIILIISQRAKNLPDSLNKIRPRLMPFILACLLMGAIIMAGFIVLIIPGFIFGLWFIFTEYCVLLENKSPVLALRASRELCRGVFFPVFWRVAGFYILFFIIAGIINSVSVAGPLAVSIIMSPFAIVYLYELYQNLSRK
ncbi:MAG: hypothetical protein V1853_05115 [bacterium]